MIVWQNGNEYLFGKTSGFKYTTKIASFDLDGTLTVTKSKKKYPNSADDWVFYNDVVPIKLKELVKNKYCLIIVSNQAGLKSESKKQEWMTKLNSIQNILKLELVVFCSTHDNEFRKPLPSFFFTETFFPQDLYEKKHEDSFYCGDACGRPGDHANTDLKFAKNCGLIFMTPEMLFLNEKSVIPKIVYPNVQSIIKTKSDFVFNPSISPEMIIMVGYPASGKSSISNMLEQQYNYIIVNQDTLKTKSKCFKYATENLKQKKSIVIDNTNRDKQTRAEWINLANTYKYNVRCILLNVSKDLAMHNNIYRYLKTGKYISKIVYNTYGANYEPPELSEGFKDIISVKKSPLGENFDEDMYQMYMY
jgi:bifunctional polynucleotide phosphatase/kinase